MQSPFSRECPQRPYECLISTIKKLPWYMTDFITIKERRAIYKATCELIRMLERSIQKGDDMVNLNHSLMRRIALAAIKCPGFTPCMKDDIIWLSSMSEWDPACFVQPRFADCWRHQYTLAPKPGIPKDVLEVSDDFTVTGPSMHILD